MYVDWTYIEINSAENVGKFFPWIKSYFNIKYKKCTFAYIILINTFAYINKSCIYDVHVCMYA